MKDNPPRRFNVHAIFYQRVHLIKVSIVPLLILVGGLYLFIFSEKAHSSLLEFFSRDLGFILSIVGIISLISVLAIDAIKTFQKWKIVEKQVHFVNTQKYPFFNLLIFIVISLVMFFRVYFSGERALKQLFYIVDAGLFLFAAWSMYTIVKDKLKGRKGLA